MSNGSRRTAIIENFIQSTLGEITDIHLKCDNMSTIKCIKRDAVPPETKTY